VEFGEKLKWLALLLALVPLFEDKDLPNGLQLFPTLRPVGEWLAFIVCVIVFSVVHNKGNFRKTRRIILTVLMGLLGACLGLGYWAFARTDPAASLKTDAALIALWCAWFALLMSAVAIALTGEQSNPNSEEP
jgi:hypothetical protein